MAIAQDKNNNPMVDARGDDLKRLLVDARPLYFLPRDNLAEEVLIPGFQSSTAASCMMGFFSSAALSDLAPGLASYIQNANSSFRMIVSPFLTESDQTALEAGLKNPEELAVDFFENGLVSADDIARLACFCRKRTILMARMEAISSRGGKI